MSVVVAALLFIGMFFGVLGAVGVVRMPDLFTRLQASTKAGTLGVGFLMVAAAIHFADMGSAVKASLVVAFLFLTAPVAAHVIARAAYIVRIPLWERTAVDELGLDQPPREDGSAPPPPPENPSGETTPS
ncbi:MAG: monovalent cation/H(+) antiporter subunit G [Phycisphaeraceae bacterium]|nr:monovalent cation/H(+) antiporter subunit G [Phycisphaeraceae bacterium]MCW5753227.1 monovalent cation/H(+) antiporter subunit G [Phycisphaeraceae bacterium]